MPSRPTLRLGGHREDKENRTAAASVMIQEDDDEDGPILYRDDDDGEMEDEGNYQSMHKTWLLFKCSMFLLYRPTGLKVGS